MIAKTQSIQKDYQIKKSFISSRIFPPLQSQIQKQSHQKYMQGIYLVGGGLRPQNRREGKNQSGNQGNKKFYAKIDNFLG